MVFLQTKNKQKGFTLLEVLLVVALIAILAGIILVAIRPAERIRQANDTQRQADVATILNAVYQYAIDNNGDLPTDGSVELSTTERHIGIDGSGCSTSCDAASGGGDCIDLSNDLVKEGYLAAIPINPGLGDASFDEGTSGYYIQKATNGTVTVGSCIDGADGAITAQR